MSLRFQTWLQWPSARISWVPVIFCITITIWAGLRQKTLVPRLLTVNHEAMVPSWQHESLMTISRVHRISGSCQVNLWKSMRSTSYTEVDTWKPLKLYFAYYLSATCHLYRLHERHTYSMPVSRPKINIINHLLKKVSTCSCNSTRLEVACCSAANLALTSASIKTNCAWNQSQFRVEECCTCKVLLRLHEIIQSNLHHASSTAQGSGGSFRKETYRRGWLLWFTDGRAKPLMDLSIYLSTLVSWLVS